MTTQTAGTAVQTSVTVDAPIEHAFDVFTTRMGDWWPPEHHILDGGVTEMTFEPRAGGRIIDRGPKGEQSWSRVLVYEPPTRVVFTWDISLQWAIETDPDRTSEVEVTFVAESPNRTLVTLEHRNIDRHGDGWEAMREAVGAADGWAVGLGRFAKAAAA